jgi:threonine dehydrogenase-like Zn-dependent dehydrogenase
MVLAACKLYEPSQVIAIDYSTTRLEIARQCGAHSLLNPKECDVVEAIRGRTEGFGCDGTR